jgi:uncharacterized membrane protein
MGDEELGFGCILFVRVALGYFLATNARMGNEELGCKLLLIVALGYFFSHECTNGSWGVMVDVQTHRNSSQFLFYWCL